jgi:hypothetical protein
MVDVYWDGGRGCSKGSLLQTSISFVYLQQNRFEMRQDGAKPLAITCNSGYDGSGGEGGPFTSGVSYPDLGTFVRNQPYTYTVPLSGGTLPYSCHKPDFNTDQGYYSWMHGCQFTDCPEGITVGPSNTISGTYTGSRTASSGYMLVNCSDSAGSSLQWSFSFTLSG